MKQHKKKILVSLPNGESFNGVIIGETTTHYKVMSEKDVKLFGLTGMQSIHAELFNKVWCS